MDFVTLLPLATVRRAFEQRGIAFQVRAGDPPGADLPWVLTGEIEGAAFDVFTPRHATPFATISVQPAGMEGHPIEVLALPDLIRLKLEAGGPKDLWDVAKLIGRHTGERDRAMDLARSLGIGAELDLWVNRSSPGRA
ncbi:MAG: hypothetical protein ABIT01_04825 [Thermoanaerobaculia bacterium]